MVSRTKPQHFCTREKIGIMKWVLRGTTSLDTQLGDFLGQVEVPSLVCVERKSFRKGKGSGEEILST